MDKIDLVQTRPDADIVDAITLRCHSAVRDGGRLVEANFTATSIQMAISHLAKAGVDTMNEPWALAVVDHGRLVDVRGNDPELQSMVRSRASGR